MSVSTLSPAASRTPRALLVRAWTALARTASATGALLERSPTLCMLLLTACVLCPAVIRARYTFFTGDEVYTLRIAQQPTIRGMLAVSRRIDLHPPLHYLAERAALALPLPVWLGARLPSLLATAATFLLCFALVRRVAGTLAGLVAAAMLWFTAALPFAWINRPYAIWLFFLALLAVCWQRAREPGASLLWTFAVFLSTTGLVLNYMAGVFCVLPFVLVGSLPVRRRRTSVYDSEPDAQSKAPWSLFLALLAPCAVGVLYLRQVKDFSTNTFSPAYLSWAGTTVEIYADLLVPVAVLTACLLAAWMLARCLPIPQKTAGRTVSPLLTLGAGLALLPVLFAILAALRHTQFFARYGGCGALGIAILCGCSVSRFTRHLRITACMAALALTIAAALRTQDAFFDPSGPWRAFSIQGVAPRTLAQLDPALPLVVARAAGFTEMNEREAEPILERTYYLYDRDAALQFSGSTVFESIALTADLLHFQNHAAPLAPFLAQHRSFYLIANYTHPEEWLPRYLVASGAHLRYLGKFASTYEDDDLYFVTLP